MVQKERMFLSDSPTDPLVAMFEADTQKSAYGHVQLTLMDGQSSIELYFGKQNIIEGRTTIARLRHMLDRVESELNSLEAQGSS